jgi:hypothetical protein
MKQRVLKRSMTVLFLLALVFGLAMALPGKTTAVQASQAKQGDAGGGGVTSASDEGLQKYDANLQEVAKAGGKEEINVRLVTQTRDVTWPDYVKAVARAIPDEATGGVVWLNWRV